MFPDMASSPAADLTRSRRRHGVIKHDNSAPNPELYWEDGGETPHSIAIISGSRGFCKQAARCPPALTRENVGDTFAALWRKCRQRPLTEGINCTRC